jgi:hypothetical protein
MLNDIASAPLFNRTPSGPAGSCHSTSPLPKSSISPSPLKFGEGKVRQHRGEVKFVKVR